MCGCWPTREMTAWKGVGSKSDSHLFGEPFSLLLLPVLSSSFRSRPFHAVATTLAALIHSHSCTPRSGGNDPLPPPRFATATATPAAAAVRGGSISSLPSIVPAPWLRTACCAGRAGQRTSSTRPADATRNQVRAWWRASPAAHYWLDGPFTRLASPQYMITGARLTRDLFFFLSLPPHVPAQIRIGCIASVWLPFMQTKRRMNCRGQSFFPVYSHACTPSLFSRAAYPRSSVGSRAASAAL